MIIMSVRYYLHKIFMALIGFAKHKSSYELSSLSKINLIEAPDIGLIPAASHLLKKTLLIQTC